MENFNYKLRLTEKGKAIYGDQYFKITLEKTSFTTCLIRFNINDGLTIASNPLELKALIDMDLVEIAYEDESVEEEVEMGIDDSDFSGSCGTNDR